MNVFGKKTNDCTLSEGKWLPATWTLGAENIGLAGYTVGIEYKGNILSQKGYSRPHHITISFRKDGIEDFTTEQLEKGQETLLKKDMDGDDQGADEDPAADKEADKKETFVAKAKRKLGEAKDAIKEKLGQGKATVEEKLKDAQEKLKQIIETVKHPTEAIKKECPFLKKDAEGQEGKKGASGVLKCMKKIVTKVAKSGVAKKIGKAFLATAKKMVMEKLSPVEVKEGDEIGFDVELHFCGSTLTFVQGNIVRASSKKTKYKIPGTGATMGAKLNIEKTKSVKYNRDLEQFDDLETCKAAKEGKKEKDPKFEIGDFGYQAEAKAFISFPIPDAPGTMEISIGGTLGIEQVVKKGMRESPKKKKKVLKRKNGGLKKKQ